MIANQTLANRLLTINESSTIKMSALTRRLKSEGKDIVNLTLGEPDFATPVHIADAAVQAIRDGKTTYPPVAGIAELKKAIVDKFQRENNLTFATDQIVVSTGAKQSIFNALMAVLNPGDEVIIPTPFWVSYPEMVKLAEGVPVFIHAGADQGFKITPEQLQEAITPATKLFMFSSPCNPSGSVYSQTELEALAAVFAQHPDIFILSDEIYEHINFVGAHHSIAQFPGMAARTIIINGVSKAFAMTGWRIGYMAADKAIAKACEIIQGQVTSGASSISQYAALAALNHSLEPTLAMRQAFRERRDAIYPIINSIKGFHSAVPDGAFYAFIDISQVDFSRLPSETPITNDEDFCLYLLNHAGVATVPGSGFGAPTCIRASFAADIDTLLRAFESIKNSVNPYAS